MLRRAIAIASVLLVTASTTTGCAEETTSRFSPEAFYQKTVETWQRKYSRRSPTSWEVWKDFATTVTSEYERIIGKDGDATAAAAAAAAHDGTSPSAVEIVGALEEGILTIERIVFREEQEGGSSSSSNHAEDASRDASLAVLYTEYGRLLLYSSESASNENENENDTTTTTTTTTVVPSSLGSRSRRQQHRCYELAKDPHTLLIGAPERLEEYSKAKKENDDDVDDEKLLASLFGTLCMDNAENAVRNAISLDESCTEGALLLETIASMSSSVPTRKPKEFVKELFDAFADTFDEQLTKTLEYRVPQIIGSKVGEIVLEQQRNNTPKQIVLFRNVLDAGCGTGLAGRELRKAIDDTIHGNSNSNGNGNNNGNIEERITLVGVDASTKMLEIAGHCTASKGCGLPVVATPTTSTTDNNKANDDDDDDDDDPKLYDALIDLDLEEMTLENTLVATTTATSAQQQPNGSGFDLIVAADVLVYFGSLETILAVFSGLHTTHDDGNGTGILVFTCERTTIDDAPLGYRVLPTGRFAHTRNHVVTAASAAGYSLLEYTEIVPRTEKGVAVDGHLFVFEHNVHGGSRSPRDNDGEL